jgi:hypothetical protein
MLFVDICSHFSELGNIPHDKMSFNVLLMGNKTKHRSLSDMYSATAELIAISVCSLLDQCIGTPAKTKINPVRDRHKFRKCANY